MDYIPDFYLDEKEEKRLESDFDHLEWMFDGYVSLVNGNQEDFNAMTGHESFYALHYDASRYAGTENKFTDGIKKAAQTLYASITDMLKRINAYFFGDAQKAAEAAVENTEAALNALNEMDGNTPISEDSPARNPDAIIKALEGGVEYNEVRDENNDLAGAMDRIKSAAEKVKDCDTVAKLRSVFNDIQKSAQQGIQSVGGALRKTLSQANSAADKLRNVKVPDEDDTAEVKAGIKEENQQASEEAKEETKKARIIGGIQNKIVGALNSLSKLSKSVKEKPAESSFKG